MQAPPHAPRHFLLPHQHNHRQQQHHRRRRGIKIHVSALLLSLVLLADKPERSRGWLNNAIRAGGQRQGGRSPASAPPGPAVPSVARLRVLQLLALERQRSRRRCLPPRLAGATDTERGTAVPVVRRDSVDRMKEWGVNGMWREAMEQLEEEGSGGLTPVSRFLLWK